MISDGLSVSQVAQKVGVSRQTLHSWLARYEAEGLEGWCLSSRGQNGSTVSMLTAMPWLVASLVNRVPSLFATTVKPFAW